MDGLGWEERNRQNASKKVYREKSGEIRGKKGGGRMGRKKGVGVTIG